MSELSDKTVCVFDRSGYCVELAIRLSREFGRVLYYKPWKTALTTNEKAIGSGYDQIEKVKDFFDVIEETDLFCFPWINDGDLQVYLESLGKRVWGSRTADQYESDRFLFMQTLKDVGLPVPKYKRCVGMTELRKYLQKNDDCYVKVPLRGDGETWHHVNYLISQAKLRAMDYWYGPTAESVAFMVVHAIGSTMEPAYDGFLVASGDQQAQFPKTSFIGQEHKNKCHILSAMDYEDIPAPLREVNDKFAPVLAKRNMRSAFGTEIKIGEDSLPYFLDATCRTPSPPGFIILEMVDNLGEHFWHGAKGDLVELDVPSKVGVQVNLYSDWAGANHEPIQIPKDIRQWVKLDECYRDEDGLDWIMPPVVSDPIQGFQKNIGAVVAIDDTVQGAIDLIKERCDQIKSFDTSAQINSLVECLERIEDANEEGVEFPVEIPEPSEVLNGE